MYGSTCADMQVDVMGECLSSIKHVFGVRSVFLAKRLHAVKQLKSHRVAASAREMTNNQSVRRHLDAFTRGRIIGKLEEGRSVTSVAAEFGTLSCRPEETGGRQREKSLDTRHRRLVGRYRILPWPEDCTVVVCLHDALYGVYL
ncbi:hypothetical protein TNCV_2120811 [Trichonephila clavipes]|nr:hypothetical protein TNCV_2120811 [Trichonephila clavipes]